MKISAIKQQVKNQTRFSVFIDGKYSFSLSELALINSGLRLNQEVSREELEALKDQANIDKGYNRVLNLLARRPRSEWELRDYLKRKNYDPTAMETILNKLSVSGYVDDKKFAQAWVTNRRLLKSTSRRRLLQELLQKHISTDIIEEVLTEDETDEREVLRELVARKRQQTRYQDDLKLMQYLSRQGYNYDDIKEVVKSED